MAAARIFMNCAECGAYVPNDSERCRECGADLTQQGDFLAAAPAVLSEANPAPDPAETDKRQEDWGFVLDREFDRLYARFKDEEKIQREHERAPVRWAGFVRRAFAFSVDLVILFILFFVVSYSSYVAYQVGLAAHDRGISDYPGPLLTTSLFGHLFVAAVYFVLFHGMDGRTIGKWLLGLRVVGRNQKPITYVQALIRWLGYWPAAIFGLGFIWIALSREKRGWHDLLARTWVILEPVSKAKDPSHDA